jgi:hypothetical protein
MRGIFSVVGLLVVLAIVGVLVKKQLGGGSGSAAASAVPGAAAPAPTPQQQVNQVKQQVEGLMQQARPMPEDEK